MNYTLLGNELV